MVTYEQFKELIREKAEEATGFRAVVNRVQKINGLVLDGLVIFKPDCNISPTIYLEQYYEQYKELMDIEEDPIQAIWNSISEIYDQKIPELDFDIEDFRDFEQMKGNIRIKLINYEKNQEWLEELAYLPFLDLACVFYVVCKSNGLENASANIYKSHMELWGCSEEELFDAAIENMKNDYVILSMIDVIKHMDVDSDMEDKMDTLPMYIISNGNKIYGASAILCRGVLKEFSRKMGYEKVAIIPSSIHECILVPLEEGVSETYFNYMVSEVNKNNVPIEEILSDHIYIYNAAENKISNCSTT